MPVSVPTMDEFNSLKAEVDNQEARITALEQGQPPQPEPTPGTTFAEEFTSDLSLWNAYAPDNNKVWQLSRWWGPDWNGWKCNDGWMVNPWNSATPWADMYQLDGSGHLALNVKKTPQDKLNACGGARYLTAQVNQLNFKQRGGYWEGRLKCPSIAGTNMAFWLMNNKSWPPEVDILEMVNHGDWVLMSQNLWHTDETTEPYYLWAPAFDPVAWHTYAFYWDTAARKMTFWFDGKVTKETNEPSGYADPMFVILGSQQGGEWSGPIPDGAQLGPLLVDYVRIYEHPPQSMATAEPAQMSLVPPKGISIADIMTKHRQERQMRHANYAK